MSVNAEQKRILIVEDDQTIRENLKEFIQMLDHDVLATVNGKEASEVFESYNPHLILCDIMMPEMNGFDFLQYINLMHPLHTSLFIFLTAKNNPEDLRTGMNLGADDYITKPFDLAELQIVIYTKLMKQESTFNAIENAKKNTADLPILGSYDFFNNNLNNIAAGAHFLKFNHPEKEDLIFQTVIKVIEQSGLKLQRSISNYQFYNSWLKEKIKIQPSNFTEIDIRKVFKKLTQIYLRQEDLVIKIGFYSFKHDTNLLKKLIEELSDNAFKFSIPGTSVIWSFNQVNQFLILDLKYVSDGFTEKDYENVKPFFNSISSETSNQGLGLGIFLIKEIIQHLNAELSLKVEKNIINYSIRLKEIS